ncbi:spermatogenesis-associated protein 17 isoform X2 [Silurus meridionalis]|uniref:spermatogenesis-associated protein 17 isoform X2 n=1 Tax=Silurus meridionalis TaxID=175797 RepID=UPI001EEA3F05|nr:spermatogenesis-associated protein 17 isoform X2 [Silurus meridionalis]
MARLVKLYDQIEHIKEQFFIRNRIAEENRQKENAAAVKIQSWFHGCRERAYLRYLHRNATVIQKTWRAFSARRYFRQRVKVAYCLMNLNFYNEMAVKIQKTWRGYYVRRYVHNYYARKSYLENLAKKNEQVRKELEELAEQQKRERERLAIEREEKEKYMQAQRLHFLLSTKQGPFRPAAEVQRQRQRPLEPSLRVATSITALEEAREELRQREWGTRLIDQPFLPFSKDHRNKEHEAFLHTHSPYHQNAYGTKYFREENKVQGKKPFKTVFTTCHVFDKFGRFYSNAGKIV